MTRLPLVAGNWKLHPPSAAAAIELARGVARGARAHEGALEVAIFPPTVWLRSVALELQNGIVQVGAQDSYWEPAGAYTGATSVAMVAGWCQWTLVGHSERRQYFGVSDDDVARSTAAAVATGLRAMVCVGEHEGDYRAGRTREVVAAQVRAALGRLGERGAEIAFAYEPVWAIGSGHTPDPQQVEEVMDLIRGEASAILGDDAASTLRVLYGGSVIPGNVATFTTLPGCDGVLVGGASLDPLEFTKLITIVGGEEVPR